MRDKFGFKNFGNNGLENYSESKVVANAHRYLPSYKKPIQNTSVSDLFKDSFSIEIFSSLALDLYLFLILDKNPFFFKLSCFKESKTNFSMSAALAFPLSHSFLCDFLFNEQV